MHITLKIIGGFTGRAGAEVHDLDVEKLPPGDATRLRGLAKAAQLESLPSKMTKAAPASWDFVHELTVQDESGSHTIRFHPDAATPELRALTDAVTGIGRK